MKYVTCLNCGWVHFEQSLKDVISWELEWEEHAKSMSDDTLSKFGITRDRLPTIEDNYLRCHGCNGSYLNFSDSLSDELPNGSTVSGILAREHKFKRKP